VLETEPRILDEYVATGKARLVYRHLTQLGDGSRFLAEVSECAGSQNAFWEMRRLIYQRQGDLGGVATYDDVATLVGELGLDQAQFRQCLDTEQFRARVEEDNAQAQRAGITSRPVLDINGTRIVGALPFGQYQRVLDAAR
jgi:protein-disulfide isomerase